MNPDDLVGKLVEITTAGPLLSVRGRGRVEPPHRHDPDYTSRKRVGSRSMAMMLPSTGSDPTLQAQRVAIGTAARKWRVGFA